MGKKIEIKKIEDMKRRQVTFSKRRDGLHKKAFELFILCDADIAAVSFSPAKKSSIFACNKSIKEVTENYVKLPPRERYPNINNVEEKLQKLEELGWAIGEDNKVMFLDNLIKQTEQKIKNAAAELERFEASVREHEPDPRQATLAELQRCENSIRKTLTELAERKKKLSNGSESTNSGSVPNKGSQYLGSPIVRDYNVVSVQGDSCSNLADTGTQQIWENWHREDNLPPTPNYEAIWATTEIAYPLADESISKPRLGIELYITGTNSEGFNKDNYSTDNSNNSGNTNNSDNVSGTLEGRDDTPMESAHQASSLSQFSRNDFGMEAFLENKLHNTRGNKEDGVVDMNCLAKDKGVSLED